MASPVNATVQRFETVSGSNEASAVSWSAVIGGAFAAAALSLALLTLGAGTGLSAISPWSSRGAPASAVGTGAIIWLIVIEILASAMGGYLAGRLRTKWVSVHTHEVYFRDTAHGFLVWCVGLVITAAFLATAAASVVGAASSETATAAAGAQAGPNAILWILYSGQAARTGLIHPSAPRLASFSPEEFRRRICLRLIGRIWLSSYRRKPG